MSAGRAEPRTPAYDPAAYWSARLGRGGQLEAAGWLGLGEAYNRWLYRRRAAVFGRIARTYGWADRPPAVLELGPGTGFYVRLWSRLGVRELTGVDIAPPAVARLRQWFPRYRFVVGDIGRPVDLPWGAFDVATAFDVLFHITDDAAFEQAIATVARALRPGGLALISDLFPRMEAVRRPHHVSRTEGDYRRALAAHGLTVERQLPVFVLMHPWADAGGSLAGRAARLWWMLVERVAGHVPGAGGPLGALLHAADALLTRVAQRGPSTRVWAVRKIGPHPVRFAHGAPSPDNGRGGASLDHG